MALLLQIWLPYARYVRLLKWLTLSLLAYVGVGFAAKADWAMALRSLVWPDMPWDRASITTVVAILGTTISPYLVFWQASQEAEEIRRIEADRPLAVAPDHAAAQFRRLRTDTGDADVRRVRWAVSRGRRMSPHLFGWKTTRSPPGTRHMSTSSGHGRASPLD